MQKGIFWDRDGVITDLVEHNGKLTAPWDLSEFKFKEDIQKAMNISHKMGYLNFVITNQPDLRDGWLLPSHLGLMNKCILQWLKVTEIRNALVRGAPDYKPNNQSVIDLANKYDVDLKKSFLIGDTWKDIVCGFQSDLTTIFIGDEYKCPAEYEPIYPNQFATCALEAIYLIQEIECYD